MTMIGIFVDADKVDKIPAVAIGSPGIQESLKRQLTSQPPTDEQPADCQMGIPGIKADRLRLEGED